MARRIISLLPSATEIVDALGCGGELVGRSHECDFPPVVVDLPVCTAPKLDPHGTSAEIHRRVEELLRDALAVYRVDADLLRSLQPTHIVTQVQCDVCAVSLDDVEAALASWQGARPVLVPLKPGTLADVFADVQRVADALDVTDRGHAVVEGMAECMDRVATRAAECSARPRVACIEWLAPMMAAGNWIPEMLEMLGAVNLCGERGQYSPWMTRKQLAESDPDVIIIFPCGFDIERTKAEMPALTDDPRWGELRAVQEGRVFVCDGNQYFNRPGPRLVESLEIFAEIVHPDVFDFGHRGHGWEPYTHADAAVLERREG